MYNPTTLEGIREAMTTEKPFMHYVRHCLSEQEYQLPEKPRILDVGCGWCPGGKNIADFFNGNLTGIDTNKKDINQARKENQGNNVEFIVGDASDVKALAPGPYDIIIARNMPPDLEFVHALKQCRSESSDSAVIFATFYNGMDFESGKRHLSDAGFAIDRAEINPYYPSSLAESCFSMQSEFFGIFGTVTPIKPGIIKRIAKLLRIN